MHFCLLSCFLLIFCGSDLESVQGFEGTLQKNTSKLSDFKAKLAKSELLSKSIEEYARSVDEFDNASISELGITVPPDHTNDTIKEDHHTYYNSTFYSDPMVAKRFWVDLDALPPDTILKHEKLSNSYRQATTVELSFDFPFYGSLLRNVTIATGGFLYMGDYLHNWIAATQYIAPLMANFDTSLSVDSVIKSADNGTAFVVQWDKVYLQGRLNDGAFTFQVVLLKNGDVIFSYKDVPYPVSSISDSVHPVKIGISDAYILERSIFFMRRKTVYEYHRIQFMKLEITNKTALYFTALPTCNGFKDCFSCVSANAKLECSWCEVVKRCSDGMDRQRQDWVAHGCVIKSETTCPVTSSTVPTITSKSQPVTTPSKEVSTTTMMYVTSKSIPSIYVPSSVTEASLNETGVRNSEMKPADTAHLMQEEDNDLKSNISIGAVITIVAFLTVVFGVGLWMFYAYKHPQTPSGQFLIKYRPSQWAFKKEETDVTSNSRHL